MNMSETTTENTQEPRSLNGLVLFLSDVAYFARRWHPVKITFRSRGSTKMLWRMARKRREVREFILEKKKENASHEARSKTKGEV
jgi:hypothetical protein